MKIRLDDLRESDLSEHPVWQFAASGGAEIVVSPVKRLPVDHLRSRLVATQVALANGQQTWALISSASANSARHNQHLATVAILWRDRWFRLAHYIEFDRETRSPEQLAKFIGLTLGDVFPISYDLRHAVRGTEEALVGRLFAEQKERLSTDQFYALALENPDLPKVTDRR